MNKELIQKLFSKSCWDEQAEVDIEDFISVEKFAELIVQHCIDVCEEMAAQMGGMPGDGALARDCANWIRKDFGVDK